MIINQILQGMVQYFTEGFLRIFTPADDQYPNIGIQPFAGEVSYSDIYFD